MSAPITPSQGCCAPQCSDATTVQVPGPAGPTGAKGDKGDTGTGATGATGATGPAGPAGPGNTLNSISPTTTRGDIVCDNGALSPSASDVRLAVGSNGKALVADSTQATGLRYGTITPNSVTADNTIPRYDGASGTPTPLQDSKVVITDDGAIRATGSGGNARGSKAVDLQVDRSAADQVASGINSVLVGGQNNAASGSGSVVGGGVGNTASALESGVGSGSGNTASGDTSVVSGGDANTASGQGSAVVGGDTQLASGVSSFIGGGGAHVASGTASTISGGTSNVSSGNTSCVSGGQTNTASGSYSSISGGKQSLANKYGQNAHASGQFAAQGDCQKSTLLWRISTTDATANIEAFLDGASQRAVVPLNTSWAFEILVMARSSAGVGAAWTIKGAIQNIAATVSLVSAVTTAVIADGTGATWGVAGSVVASADNVNKSLKIAVTGAAATLIRWGVTARLMEINY